MFLSQTVAEIMDRLALGVAMFGDHAVWLWLLPPAWGIAICVIVDRMECEKEERDRFYVAIAERNLPKLREVLKQRSTEILEVRPINRDIKIK